MLVVTRLNKNKLDSYWRDVWMKFKSGDAKAFELIYCDHVDFLYSYGTKITADTELVEDTIHDLFLYILSRKDHLSNPDYVRFYLLTAFKRILLEKIRTEKKWMKESNSEIFAFDFSIEKETSSSFDDEKERQLLLIEELVEQLDSRKKEVIFLKFHSGLSYDQIGDIVGIQSSSVKKMVYRTISSFRDVLKIKIIEFFFLFVKRPEANT